MHFQADISAARDAQQQEKAKKYVTPDMFHFLFIGNRHLKYGFGLSIESLWYVSASFDYFVILNYENVYQMIFAV